MPGLRAGTSAVSFAERLELRPTVPQADPEKRPRFKCLDCGALTNRS